jgi:NAD(P)H-nitrite reductase large subunit
MKHVIIGNGPTGVVAAETLRKADRAATITLVGDEPGPPYSRMALPYLMTGRIDEAGTLLRKTPGHYAAHGIELVEGHVAAVDGGARRVRFADGRSLDYDRLLVATGSHPIIPPIAGVDLPGVHACWTLDDARRIMGGMASGARILQVGAGFIGCIIMEALSSRGAKLTVVEMGDRMVPRMMTPAAGTMIRDWCAGRGVQVHLEAHVDSIERSGGALVARLRSGEVLAADMIIVSAGVRPNVAFLEGSGVACATGILVDATMQTNVPGIYAAGDVAEAIIFGTGKPGLNAIVPAAVDQARVAALNMAGTPVASRGYLSLNVLDTLGLISSSFGQWWPEPGGETVESIDKGDYRYLCLQFSDDVLVGATAIGLTEHVGVLRGLIEGRVRLGPWKDRLLREPHLIGDAYLARGQAAA